MRIFYVKVYVWENYGNFLVLIAHQLQMSHTSKDYFYLIVLIVHLEEASRQVFMYQWIRGTGLL